MYDLYVPIVQNVEMKVPYDRAKEMIAEGLSPGERYLNILHEDMKAGGSMSWRMRAKPAEPIPGVATIPILCSVELSGKHK